MGNVAPGASGVAPLKGYATGALVQPGGRGPGFSVQTEGDDLSHSDILSRHQFVRQLQIEKRRTDRSRVPLSLVLFKVDTEHRSLHGKLGALADLLRQTKRETDVLGYLADGLLGLLLTHTDKDGLQGLIRNVEGRAAGLSYTTTSGTYPDQIFASLIAQDQGQPDTLPYFLEHDTEHGEVELFLKRCLDLVGATALLLALGPIMIATAIAVKATSPGPVVYTQMRLGRKGIPFVFYKFRSMTTGADESVHREYVTHLIQGRHDAVNQGDAETPHYKLKADPRVTRVGAFIRRTSIDELPQLFNVLKGDMSLVGPRPPITYEAENYQSWHLRRILESRPGITGLWQVEGRNKVAFDDMVRLDLRYTRTWSLWLDIKILFRTVAAVLRFDGEG